MFRSTRKNEKEFISDEKLGRSLQIGDSLAQYAHQEHIDALLFVDRSARLAYIPFQESWRRLYPGEPIPARYFTNGRGYELENATIAARMERADAFIAIYKRLKRHDRLLLFDTCMHTGDTIESIMGAITDAGFLNVRVALAQQVEEHCKKAQHVVSHYCLPEELSCYPFGEDSSMVSTDTRGLLSEPNDYADYEQRAGRATRSALFRVQRTARRIKK